MIRVDLHTHSTASRDGGITEKQYEKILNGTLDCVAITDHNRIDLALQLKKRLGNKIIVGEEIDTQEGEIIGLFLAKPVSAGLSLEKAIKAIKNQGGLVYVPHPLETVRKGIQEADLENVKNRIDIIEVYNGRAAVQNKGPKAATWARINRKVSAASSDAHGIRGIGRTYTSLETPPTAKNLVQQLKTARLTTKRAPVHSLFYPKYHRVRRALKRGKV